MKEYWDNIVALFKRRTRLTAIGDMFKYNPDNLDRLGAAQALKSLNDKGTPEWQRYKLALRQRFVDDLWTAMKAAGTVEGEKAAIVYLHRASMTHELLMDISYPGIEILEMRVKLGLVDEDLPDKLDNYED